MATVATVPPSPSAVHDKFEKGPGLVGTLIFVAVLIIGIGITNQLMNARSGTRLCARFPFGCTIPPVALAAAAQSRVFGVRSP